MTVDDGRGFLAIAIDDGRKAIVQEALERAPDAGQLRRTGVSAAMFACAIVLTIAGQEPVRRIDLRVAVAPTPFNRPRFSSASRRM